MNIHKLLSYALPAAILVSAPSCKPDLDEAGFGSGSVNLSHYVAFGDGFTAGVANGGIYRTAQEYSYPAILAAQMQKAGAPATFLQPYFENSGTGYYRLIAPAQTDTVAADQAVYRGDFTNTTCYPFGERKLFTKYTSAPAATIQNLGVPNMRLASLSVANMGNASVAPVTTGNISPNFTANPYFERLLPDASSESYVQIAYNSNATFFTVWFGLDDMMNWALSGGTCGQRPMPTNNITGPVITALLDTLAAKGAKGVVGRIPRVVEFPYFKLVNNNELKQKAKQVTNNPAATVYHLVNNQPTEISDAEIILYHALATIGQPDANGNLHGFSPQNPLTNAEVLTPTEIGLLNGAASSFNLALPQLLEGKRKFPVAYLDNFISGILTGYQSGGITYSGNYNGGEFFSLDGLHFSARGNALIANNFIEVINSYYGAFIPQVNPGDFPSTQRP